MPKKPAINKIEVTNMRGVKHVEVKIEKHLVVIGGLNGSGKSSLAKAIEATCGGMRGTDSLLRDGAQIGSCVVDLGDRKIVRVVKRRKDGTESTTVDYIDIDGQPVKKTQERLDALTRKLTWNTMGFYDEHPNDQIRILLQAVGVDYAPLDRQIAEIELERVAVGRERDKCRGALAKFPTAWNPPTEELSAADLSRQMVEAHRINGANDEQRRAVRQRAVTSGRMQEDFNTAKGYLTRHMFDEEQLVKELARATANLEKKRNEIRQAKEDIERRRSEGRAFLAETERIAAAADALVDTDTSEIESQMEQVEQHNEEYRRGQDRAKWAREMATYSAQWDGFDAAIQEVHKTKRKMLAEAEFPVEGLEIGERGIVLRDRPIHLWNETEKLKLTLAIAYKQADPDLPLVILDGAERLDPSNLKIVEEMAEQAGIVTLAMRVANDGTCTICLQDGQVIGAEQWADEVLNGPLEVSL